MRNEDETTPEYEQGNTEGREDINTTLPLVPQLLVALVILIIIFSLSYIPSSSDNEATVSLSTQSEKEADSRKTAPDTDYFKDITIEAQSAYVWDVRKQEALYSKNAEIQHPLASLTKLMTVLVAAEHLELNDTVNIGIEAISQEGESGFEDGASFSFESLTDLTLITSSNDGAYALAVAAGREIDTDDSTSTPTYTFIQEMNKKTEKLGLSQTYYVNPTGLDQNETESGGYGSARDMAFLMEHIITQKPGIFERTGEDFFLIRDTHGALYNAENTNMLTRDIPGLIASKTGYTTLAGGNLVVAFDAGFNRPIIISVLGSSREGRFADVDTLIERTKSAVTAD